MPRRRSLTIEQVLTRLAATPTHPVAADGEAIRIQASDDVMVPSVQVMILNEQGKAIEKGDRIKERQGRLAGLCAWCRGQSGTKGAGIGESGEGWITGKGMRPYLK